MNLFDQMNLLESIGTNSSVPFPEPDNDSVASGVYTVVCSQAFFFPFPLRSAL